jgi:hypothetical protein
MKAFKIDHKVEMNIHFTCSSINRECGLLISHSNKNIQRYMINIKNIPHIIIKQMNINLLSNRRWPKAQIILQKANAHQSQLSESDTFFSIFG